MPRNSREQICRNTTIHIKPQPDRINEYEDFFGNKVIYFSIEKEHWELTVHVTSEVERMDSGDSQTNDFPDASLEEVKKKLLDQDADAMEIKQYLFVTPMTEWNEVFCNMHCNPFLPGRSVFEATKDLTLSDL